MVGIKNIAVNSGRMTILFDFFIESERDLPILLDIVSSKFISTFCLNDFSVVEEEIQEIFIELIKPMVERIKYTEENRMIIEKREEEKESLIGMYLNYNFK